MECVYCAFRSESLHIVQGKIPPPLARNTTYMHKYAPVHGACRLVCRIPNSHSERCKLQGLNDKFVAQQRSILSSDNYVDAKKYHAHSNSLHSIHKNSTKRGYALTVKARREVSETARVLLVSLSEKNIWRKYCLADLQLPQQQYSNAQGASRKVHGDRNSKHVTHTRHNIINLIFPCSRSHLTSGMDN